MDDLRRRLADDLDKSFPELVISMQHEIYSGLRSLAGNDAEDLAQETFIRAYRALREYPAERIFELRLRGWMWTIALNLGRNHLRDRAKRPLPASEALEASTSDPDPPDLEAWQRRLSTLPAPMRKAVVLRHVVGLDYAEIADALARPVGTVKADVHRGLERLRLTMEKET